MKKYWVIISLVVVAAIGIYLTNGSESQKVATNTVETVKDNSSSSNGDNINTNPNQTDIATKDSITKAKTSTNQPSNNKGNESKPSKTISKPQYKPLVDSDDNIIGSFKEIELIHNNLKLNKKMTKDQYNNFLSKYCYTKEYSKLRTEIEWNKEISLSNFTEVKVITKDNKQTSIKALDKGNGSKWFSVTMLKVEGRWLVSKIQ